VPSRDSAKNDGITDNYGTLPEILAERIRIQNLRFAHFLCGAQEMSGVIKRSSSFARSAKGGQVVSVADGGGLRLRNYRKVGPDGSQHARN
jgi:hypothetical protein